MAVPIKPMLLIVIDGWGYREASENNAIALSHTPTWDKIWEQYPHTLISGSGDDVGLPHGQMGNSEVGHMNLGAGRIVYQDLSRIERAIADGSFFTNPELINFLQNLKQQNRALHIMGLLSPGGVHSHENHIIAMLKLAAAQKLSQIYIHAFLDGRDTPPQSAQESIAKLEHAIQQLKAGKIASIVGRYYAMDRDKRWDRVEQAYQLIVDGNAPYHAPSAEEGLLMAYDRGETDEFVKPTRIGKDLIRMEDGDGCIFMNFRSDRARQISHALLDEEFIGFTRSRKPQLSAFLTLTEYEKNLPVKIIFPPQSLDNVLGQHLENLGLTQLRIAETEKYAHVTFFFNGGREQAFVGEERILIPSPKVATYDLKPEMSAFELTEQLIAAIKSAKFSVIVCNFANPDMVGHTGNIDAAIRAVETIDTCLGKILTALDEVGGEALITADHGNVEEMYDPSTAQPHTAHTTNPVPLIYVGRPAKALINDGKLSDVAPTLLQLMGLEIPSEMSGRILFALTN